MINIWGEAVEMHEAQMALKYIAVSARPGNATEIFIVPFESSCLAGLICKKSVQGNHNPILWFATRCLFRCNCKIVCAP